MANAAVADTLPKHSLLDDALGLATGVVLVSLGVHLLQTAGLVTGQTAGAAVLLSYAGGWEFGVVFFLINLPFYALAIWRMGWVFTLRTLLAVTGMSVLTPLMKTLLPFGAVDPWTAAIAASVTASVGLLVLFRHRASMGGVGVLAVYLQDRIGFRAGWTQLLIDACIFAGACFVIPMRLVVVSFLGVVILNLLIALNHRRDRYVAQ